MQDLKYFDPFSIIILNDSRCDGNSRDLLSSSNQNRIYKFKMWSGVAS